MAAVRSKLRTHFTPGYIVLALTCLAAWVASFQLLRLLLFIVNRDLASDASLADLLGSFVVGLQFDLSMAAYLLLPLLSFSMIAGCILGLDGMVCTLAGGSLLCGSIRLLLLWRRRGRVSIANSTLAITRSPFIIGRSPAPF